MKKLQWYTMGVTKPGKIEKVLMRKVTSLYKFCKKNEIPYADIYVLSIDGSCTLNVRAKDKREIVVADAYAFVREL